jgi:hypothetical protein
LVQLIEMTVAAFVVAASQRSSAFRERLGVCW